MSVSENLERALKIPPHASILASDIAVDGDMPLVPAKEPAVLVVSPVESTLSNNPEKSDMAADYIYARNLNYALLETMGGVLASAVRVAIESEHPRAYEAANALAGTLMNVQKELLGLQKTFKDVVKDNPHAPSAMTVNNTTNNVFTGSTHDLMALLEEQEKKNKSDNNIIDSE